MQNSNLSEKKLIIWKIEIKTVGGIFLSCVGIEDFIKREDF